MSSVWVWLIAGFMVAGAMGVAGIWLVASWARDVRAARRQDRAAQS